jgi:hypothetical protein
MSANTKETDMENAQELFEEDRSLAWRAVVYYVVILIAFIVGRRQHGAKCPGARLPVLIAINRRSPAGRHPALTRSITSCRR